MPTDSILYLKVAGNPYDIGYQIGEHFQSNIHSILDEFEDYEKHKNRFSDKRSFIQQMLNESKRLCPTIIEEIEGMAEACATDFIDLFIHNSMHMPQWANCSTSIMKEKEAIYIAHNEDAHPLLEKYAYFVYIKPENPELIPFFSHCYPGIVPGMSYGFNMTGIIQTCNSLPDPTKSIGVPRMFVGRTIYETSKTIQDALDVINSMKPRSGGASYTLGSSQEQKIVNVETTGVDYSVIEIEERFFRANHYISEKFKQHPEASDHTIIRQNRGMELLPKIQESHELLEIMQDESIYLTMEGTNNDCQTNSTLLIEITKDNIEIKKYDGLTVQGFKSLNYHDLN